MDADAVMAGFAGIVALIGGLILALGLSSYVNNTPNQFVVTLGAVIFALGLAILAVLGHEDSAL